MSQWYCVLPAQLCSPRTASSADSDFWDSKVSKSLKAMPEGCLHPSSFSRVIVPLQKLKFKTVRWTFGVWSTESTTDLGLELAGSSEAERILNLSQYIISFLLNQSASSNLLYRMVQTKSMFLPSDMCRYCVLTSFLDTNHKKQPTMVLHLADISYGTGKDHDKVQA